MGVPTLAWTDFFQSSMTVTYTFISMALIRSLPAPTAVWFCRSFSSWHLCKVLEPSTTLVGRFPHPKLGRWNTVCRADLIYFLNFELSVFKTWKITDLLNEKNMDVASTSRKTDILEWTFYDQVGVGWRAFSSTYPSLSWVSWQASFFLPEHQDPMTYNGAWEGSQ